MTEYFCKYCHQRVLTNADKKACYDCGKPLFRKEK